MDTVHLLKSIRDTLWKDIQKGNINLEDYGDLIQQIDETLTAPTMQIAIPNGKLCVSIAHDESVKASTYIETEEGSVFDLFLAEAPEDDLLEIYKENEGLEEGDIRMLVWSDPANEDYTHKFTVKAEEIKEVSKDENKEWF